MSLGLGAQNGSRKPTLLTSGTITTIAPRTWRVYVSICGVATLLPKDMRYSFVHAFDIPALTAVVS
jgi:hypothetical protein